MNDFDFQYLFAAVLINQLYLLPQVYIATAEGGLIVMDVHGNIVSKVM